MIAIHLAAALLMLAYSPPAGDVSYTLGDVVLSPKGAWHATGLLLPATDQAPECTPAGCIAQYAPLILNPTLPVPESTAVFSFADRDEARNAFQTLLDDPSHRVLMRTPKRGVWVQQAAGKTTGYFVDSLRLTDRFLVRSSCYALEASEEDSRSCAAQLTTVVTERLRKALSRLS